MNEGNVHHHSSLIKSRLLTSECQCQPSNDPMHSDGGVEGDVSVEERFAQSSDCVSTHGHQKTRVSEHHRRRSTSRDGHAITGDATEPYVFPLD